MKINYRNILIFLAITPLAIMGIKHVLPGDGYFWARQIVFFTLGFMLGRTFPAFERKKDND